MTAPGPETPPRVSVCVPTRNRGTSLTATLTSFLRLDHDSFEVVVVDQSTDNLSAAAFRATVGDDPRFAHIPSATVGKSAACNVALARARGAIVAFTDDDCEAPPDWLTGIERAFAAHPEVAMICAGVVAAAHDPAHGAIPSFVPRRARLLRSPWLAFTAAGIGANLAFRSQALRDLGAFDEVLGAGAPLRAGEDGDIEYRVLRAGLGILELPGPAVLHSGLRTWGTELQQLSWDSALSEGAIYTKHVRLRDPAVLLTFAIRGLSMVHWGNLVLLRKPTGIGRLAAFTRGVRMSFRFPIDRTSRRYRNVAPERGAGPPG